MLVVPRLQGVGDGNGEDSTDFVSPRLVDQAAQLERTQAGTHRVVNQYPVVRVDQARCRDDSVEHAVGRPRRRSRAGQAGCEGAPVVPAKLRVPRREHHEGDFHFRRPSRRAIE